MKLLISPHNDDAALFAAFTCLRERPLVVTIFDSFVQGMRGFPLCCSRDERRREDREALEFLGCKIDFLALRDDRHYHTAELGAALSKFLYPYTFDGVYGPAYEVGGHDQHNMVAMELGKMFPGYTPYLTYTENGKSTDGVLVGVNEDDWIPRKLQALACYRSQMIPELGCRPHFLRSQEEYYQRGK